LKNAGAPKVIPRFPDEKAALKLVFATMIRAVDRWCCVSISDLPRHQLKLLRVELGLDPPPANTVTTKPTGATAPRMISRPSIYRTLKT
jgi:hypothetical protein